MKLNIQTGDLLFFKPTGFWGRVVCWMTGSEYCHVGLAHIECGRVYVIDFCETGFRCATLSEIEANWPGEADVYRVNEQISFSVLRRVVHQMFWREWQKYGYLHILKTGLLRVLPTWLTSFFILKECERSAPHCSEAVCNAYRWAAGIDLVPGIPDWHTSPGDIVRAGKIEKVS